jgi:hypothetical protein
MIALPEPAPAAGREGSQSRPSRPPGVATSSHEAPRRSATRNVFFGSWSALRAGVEVVRDPKRPRTAGVEMRVAPSARSSQREHGPIEDGEAAARAARDGLRAGHPVTRACASEAHACVYLRVPGIAGRCRGRSDEGDPERPGDDPRARSGPVARAGDQRGGCSAADNDEGASNGCSERQPATGGGHETGSLSSGICTASGRPRLFARLRGRRSPAALPVE